MATDRPSGDEVAQLGVRAAEAYGRPDLAARLQAARRRAADTGLTVVVVGEFKQGKSSLVNALVGSAVCPVDDDVATAIPTVLRWSDRPQASAVVRPADGGAARDESFAPADLAAWVTERGAGPDVQVVHVGLASGLLRDGLRLIDTSGAGGLASARTLATVAALPHADAALFVTDASQELTRAELDFFALAHRLCPRVRCVVTKIDLYPAWRRVVELDAGHLDAAGLPADVLATSSVLDGPESGVAELGRWLVEELAGSVERGDAALAGEVLAVSDHLAAQFRAEREALLEPSDVEAMVADLDGARRRAERVRASGARWSVALNDGIAELTAHVDHDLRARFRDLTRRADEAIDGMDPARSWGELERWLSSEVAHAVGENHAFLQERAEALVAAVAEVLDADARAVAMGLTLGAAEEALGGAAAATDLKLRRPGLVGSGLTVLRGTYGGMAMFSMLGGVAGLAMAMPVVVLVGVVLGGKGLRDERDRQRAQHQAQARTAARRYLDEVSFAVTKDTKDTLRGLQRHLRDRFQAEAEQLGRTAADALAGAERALAVAHEGRERRLADIEAELGRIDALRHRAVAVLGHLATVPA